MYTDNIRHNNSDNSFAVSDAARKAKSDNFRVMDIDQFGYCARCLDVIYITEATSATSDKSTLMVRHLAKKLGAIAIFIKHDWEDRNHENPIYLAAWKHTGEKWQPTDGAVERTSWSSYIKLIENCQKYHEQRTGCKKVTVYHKDNYPGAWINGSDYRAATEKYMKKLEPSPVSDDLEDLDPFAVRESLEVH